MHLGERMRKLKPDLMDTYVEGDGRDDRIRRRKNEKIESPKADGEVSQLESQRKE